MLTVAVTRSCDDNAICYVFPVLWMTSFYRICGTEIAHFRCNLISFTRGCHQCTHSLWGVCGLR